MNKDLYSNVVVTQSLTPAVRTADANGTGVDLAGYESATVLFEFGNSADTLSETVYVVGVVQESANNSDFTDVAAADLIGTCPTIDAPAEDTTTAAVGYRGSKRYIRAKLDFTGTHTTGIPCATSVIKGHPTHAPTA